MSVKFTDRKFVSKISSAVTRRSSAVGKAIAEDVYRYAKMFLKSKFIYQIDVTSMFMSMPSELISNHFKHITITKNYRNNMSDTDSRVIESQSGASMDIKMYKGTPIILYVSEGKQRDNSDYILSTIYTKKHKKNLDKFVDKLCHCVICSSEHDKRGVYRTTAHGYTPLSFGFPKRSFNDVFMKKNDKDLIIHTIEKFLNSRSWYEKHHIPYHFGLILYGEPGTGKSSIIQAIVNKFNFNKIVVEGDSIHSSLNSIKDNEILSSETTTAIIIEDADLTCCPVGDRNDMRVLEAAERYKHNLGYLMNSMDGIGCFQNVIYIFSTNSIEDIDPAILRPGRLDLHVNISYVCDETMNQFLKFHYGKQMPENYHVKDKLIFAEMQIDVMRGYSFDQMLKKYAELS